MPLLLQGNRAKQEQRPVSSVRKASQDAAKHDREAAHAYGEEKANEQARESMSSKIFGKNMKKKKRDLLTDLKLPNLPTTASTTDTKPVAAADAGAAAGGRKHKSRRRRRKSSKKSRKSRRKSKKPRRTRRRKSKKSRRTRRRRRR